MSLPPENRRQKIELMLQAQPDDVFLRYALALEMDKTGEHEDALTIFKGLMEEPSPYVPAFFMAGQMLARLDRLDEARLILTDGIAQANAQGNLHAAGEMQGFLEMID